MGDICWSRGIFLKGCVIISVSVLTPHKRKPKRELTQQQKDENQALSSNRIFIEHLIRLLKIFRIASQRFRLKLDTYEQIILTEGGLVRLRIGSLTLPT
jgi:hypothetical protein